MNLTEWILASAVVLLWLYAWSLSHRIGVLREEYGQELKQIRSVLDAFQREVRIDYVTHISMDLVASSWRRELSSIRVRLDKLDPPRRRATDVKPCPIAMTGKQVDWVWGDEPPTRMKLRKKKAAKR